MLNPCDLWKAQTKRRTLILLAPFSLLGVSGCQTIYFAAMEKLGREKRDILVKRILTVKKDQEQTQEQLKTTLEAFKEVTGFEGGNLEKTYNRLNDSYERCRDRANDLHNHVNSVDDVAKRMFSEWKGEVKDMRNFTLKRQSQALLTDAQRQHSSYMQQMRSTENRIKPVLQAFGDQVVFLKHNLNARAISSLKKTSADLDLQASDLIREINASSREADQYIQTLSHADAVSK
jgi:ElaB/YqjD/DUF883 family membrane-anchored ribosome-binding protein